MGKNWRVTLATVLVFVLAIAAAAFADETDSEIGKTIAWAWTNLFQVAGALIAGFVIKILMKLAKKYGIEVSRKQKDQIQDWTADAIMYADEWARKRVLEKATVKFTDKFDHAVKRLSEKVPYLTEERIRELIVTNLPKVRMYIDSKINT